MSKIQGHSHGKNLSPEFTQFVNNVLHRMVPKNKEEEVLKKYIKIILSMAYKYKRYGVEYEDIVMAGITGLLEAVKSYDYKREYGFTPYAIICITNQMYELALHNASQLTIPSYIAKVKIYIRKMTRILEQEPIIFQQNINIAEVISVFESPYDVLLANTSLKNIQIIKQKIENIARSANISYEVLVQRAIIDRFRDTSVSENEYKSNTHLKMEERIIALEAGEKAMRGLSDKKMLALALYYQGYNNEDIADIFYQTDITAHRVTRQAVKLMVDQAKRRIVRAKNIWPDV